MFFPMSGASSNVSSYLGIGIAAYSPLGVEMSRQTGKRAIWGIEGAGDGWTLGAEVEADLPDSRDNRLAGYDLIPTVRIGFAVRRHF
jgi:hypothetical protein